MSRDHQKIMKSSIGNNLFSYVNYFQLLILYKPGVYSKVFCKSIDKQQKSNS